MVWAALGTRRPLAGQNPAERGQKPASAKLIGNCSGLADPAAAPRQTVATPAAAATAAPATAASPAAISAATSAAAAAMSTAASAAAATMSAAAMSAAAAAMCRNLYQP